MSEYADECLELNPKADKKHRFFDFIRGIFGLLISFSIMVVTYYFRDQISSMAGLSYLGLFLACFAANSSVLFPASSALIVIGATTALNPLWCGIFGGAGAAAGELVSYMIGRSGSRMAGDMKAVSKLEALMDKHGFLIVFIFSLLPLPIYDLAGLAAGLAKLNPVKYITACILGKVPKTICYAYFGNWLLGYIIAYLSDSMFSQYPIIQQLLEGF